MSSVIAKEVRLKQSQHKGDCFATLTMTILFGFLSFLSLAQSDTTSTHGTIKIGKTKKEKIYINAVMDFNNYNFSRTGIYAPFPGVEDYTFPFNYTKYFTDKFKNKEIDLRGKLTDTVRIGIKILKNGNAYIKDQTLSLMVKGISTSYDEKVEGYELSRLQINSLDFLKQIKSWEPAYIETPKQSKYKKQTVIKPDITEIDASGILTVVFSSIPFE